MQMSAVLSTLSRDRRDLPGLTATARVDRDIVALVKRLRVGEIAVLDQVDLDRPTADALVTAGVVGVVNVSESISGRYPNLGPQVLLAAGITLIDGVGPEVLRVRDGAKLRLHDGAVIHGEKLIGRGVPQTAELVNAAMVKAKDGMGDHLEAFSANTIEFMRRDRALLLDGLGVPDVRVRLADRHVLVVAPGTDHVEDLARLRRYIKECRPVLVGVDAGADALWNAGYRPDLVVGDPAEVSDKVLTSGADVVVHAFADGHAPGLHRVQDLGAGAVTFPASGNTEDLALLLAHHHGAGLIVTVGYQATLAEFLDRSRQGRNASTFLTRLKVGGLVVDAKSAAALHRTPVSAGAVMVLIVAVLLVFVAALAVTPVGPAALGHTERAVESVIQTATGWFK
ncbi:MAG TPA: putative cytokinetic ring protein SteA [Pseudonocardia sp.]|nr:putative cytokinetic ring protein SteA [Pseudonocardia sp.]